jgi:hypothetical protein
MGRKAQAVCFKIEFESLKIDRYFGDLSRLCGEKFELECEKRPTTKSCLGRIHFINFMK